MNENANAVLQGLRPAGLLETEAVNANTAAAALGSLSPTVELTADQTLKGLSAIPSFPNLGGVANNQEVVIRVIIDQQD